LPAGDPSLHCRGGMGERQPHEQPSTEGMPAGQHIGADPRLEHRHPGHQYDHHRGQIAGEQTGDVCQKAGIQLQGPRRADQGETRGGQAAQPEGAQEPPGE
jgi:hypothetical protein